MENKHLNSFGHLICIFKDNIMTAIPYVYLFPSKKSPIIHVGVDLDWS